MQAGFIKLYRSLIDNHLWRSLSADHRVVMVTVLLLARWKSCTWSCPRCGAVVEVPAGGFAGTLREVTSAASVGRQAVRTAAKRMCEAGFLTMRKHRCHAVFAVTSWARYQQGGDDEPTTGQPRPNRSSYRKKAEKKNGPSLGIDIRQLPLPLVWLDEVQA